MKLGNCIMGRFVFKFPQTEKEQELLDKNLSTILVFLCKWQ